MNSTSIPEFSGYQLIAKLEEIGFKYVGRSIGGLGVIINLFFLFVYSNKTLRNLYSFQWCHCFTNMVVCLFASLVLETIKQNTDTNTYELIIVNFIINLPFRMALTASVFSDVLRVINRYSDLIKKETFLSKLSKLANLAICFGLGVAVFLPTYIGMKIKASKSSGMSYWELNEFGTSQYFSFYVLFLFFIETLIPLIILTTLNLLSVRYYRRDRYERIRYQITITGLKKIELRFTRTVLRLNMILIVSRGLDMIIETIFRLTLIGILLVDYKTEILIRGFKQLSFCILIAVHAFESLVYLKMDQNIKRVVSELFQRNNRNLAVSIEI